jgi:hypothetical protein
MATGIDDGYDFRNFSLIQIVNLFLGLVNLFPVLGASFFAPVYAAQLFILVEILNKALAIFNVIMLAFSIAGRLME